MTGGALAFRGESSPKAAREYGLLPQTIDSAVAFMAQPTNAICPVKRRADRYCVQKRDLDRPLDQQWDAVFCSECLKVTR